MKKIIASGKETDKRVFTFPTSQVKLNGQKSSYYEVIHSLEFPECNAALKRIYEKINIRRLETLVDDTPLISDVQKAFYKHMLNARYEKILKASAELLLGE